MNCHEAQALLHASLDGELDVVNDVALTQHVGLTARRSPQLHFK